MRIRNDAHRVAKRPRLNIRLFEKLQCSTQALGPSEPPNPRLPRARRPPRRRRRAEPKELEKENDRLRKALSGLTLEKLFLKEAASGNF